jgi:hypothetical protein
MKLPPFKRFDSAVISATLPITQYIPMPFGEYDLTGFVSACE